MAQPQATEDDHAAKERHKKAAHKASVMFARQGDPVAEKAKGESVTKKTETSCCAPLEKIFYQDILGFPDPNKSAAQALEFGEKQDLPRLKPVPIFKEAPAEQRCGITVTTNSAAKEQNGWVNQDNFAAQVLPDAGDGAKRFFFGVFDGHGRFGHDVSEIIATRLASHLVASGSLEGDLAPKKAFKEAMTKVDDDVYANMGHDVEYSGSTCVCCLVDWSSRTLHTSNVGDSRAIIGRQNFDGSWQAVQLSEDQRPDLDDERERIEMSGGVVASHKVDGVEDGPARVWDSPALEKPGLACARSVGDGAARVLGVIPTPVVTSRKLQEEDRFILICSDGVWDALSNQEAVDILKMYLHVPFVGAKAMTEAVRRVEGGGLVDDTTMVLVVLPQP